MQRVPPLRAWSSVPPTGKKAPGWFLCPGVGTTGFQFVSRKSPFLGWEDGEKSRDWEQRREFARMLPGVSP